MMAPRGANSSIYIPSQGHRGGYRWRGGGGKKVKLDTVLEKLFSYEQSRANLLLPYKNRLYLANSVDFSQLGKSRARFCKRLKSLGIESKKSIPPAYAAWRAGMTNRVIVPTCQATKTGGIDSLESIPWHQFLGSLLVYKFGLLVQSQHPPTQRNLRGYRY
jgi:hypothetical protein